MVMRVFYFYYDDFDDDMFGYPERDLWMIKDINFVFMTGGFIQITNKILLNFR